MNKADLLQLNLDKIVTNGDTPAVDVREVNIGVIETIFGETASLSATVGLISYTLELQKNGNLCYFKFTYTKSNPTIVNGLTIMLPGDFLPLEDTFYNTVPTQSGLFIRITGTSFQIVGNISSGTYSTTNVYKINESV